MLRAMPRLEELYTDSDTAGIPRSLYMSLTPSRCTTDCNMDALRTPLYFCPKLRVFNIDLRERESNIGWNLPSR